MADGLAEWVPGRVGSGPSGFGAEWVQARQSGPREAAVPGAEYGVTQLFSHDAVGTYVTVLGS